jgi:hypothetical protein
MMERKDGKREGMEEKRVEIMSKEEMPKKEIKARSFLLVLSPLFRKNQKERRKNGNRPSENPLLRLSVCHDLSSTPLSTPFSVIPPSVSSYSRCWSS